MSGSSQDSDQSYPSDQSEKSHQSDKSDLGDQSGQSSSDEQTEETMGKSITSDERYEKILKAFSNLNDEELMSRLSANMKKELAKYLNDRRIFFRRCYLRKRLNQKLKELVGNVNESKVKKWLWWRVIGYYKWERVPDLDSIYKKLNKHVLKRRVQVIRSKPKGWDPNEEYSSDKFKGPKWSLNVFRASAKKIDPNNPEDIRQALKYLDTEKNRLKSRLKSNSVSDQHFQSLEGRNLTKKCPKNAEEDPYKIYFRRKWTRSETPWEWLYRTEPNLRFVNELHGIKRKEQSKKGEKSGKQRGPSEGILKFADKERLVIDDKLPAYERTFAEYGKQIDKLPPNDPHPYHLWYKTKNVWIELPNTEANIRLLRKETLTNADIQFETYTEKYIIAPPTLKESEGRLEYVHKEKKKQGNSKTDSSQGSQSSKNKDKIDDDEELKKLEEELERGYKKMLKKDKKKRKKKKHNDDEEGKKKSKKKKKKKKDDNGGPLGTPVSPNTAHWQTVSKELNDMTQTWQNELNMKFDRKIVTWQLDVIPSMIGVPNVNFSFLPTIDHLYEIASNPLTQSTGHTIVNQDWELVLEEWDDIEADQTHREDLRKLKTPDGKKAYVKALLRLMNDLRQRIRPLLPSGSPIPQAPHLRSNMMIADILAADYNMIGRIAKDFKL